VAQSECLGGEALLFNGKLAGSVTSAAFGHTVNKSLAIAFVSCEFAEQTDGFTIGLFGETTAARVLKDIPFDATNARTTS